MLQGCVVSHGPNVWLCGHLYAVLQGEGDGHSAECGGIRGHRPRHRDPVWPRDHDGPQCGAVYGRPVVGPAGWSGITGGNVLFCLFCFCFLSQMTSIFYFSDMSILTNAIAIKL